MAIIENHAPGSFCWIELATSDQAAAKKFYSSLFGWGAMDFPMGPGQVYTMFALDGRHTGATYTIDPKHMPGVPPNWTLYVDVADANATAEKATQAGGKILGGPFDVAEFGRMAVLQDPTGAVLCVWQPKSHQGIGISGVPGTLSWADLSTPDPKAAKPFYQALFGWQIEPGENDKSGYLHIKNGENFIGGVPPVESRNQNMPPHWLSYLHVDSADASAAKVKELGGQIHFGPMTMENVGRWAVAADPQGAVFALFQPPEHHR